MKDLDFNSFFQDYRTSNFDFLRNCANSQHIFPFPITSEDLNMIQAPSTDSVRNQRCGAFYAFLAGMASAVAIYTIAVIKLDFTENLANSTMRSSNGRRLQETKLVKNYNLDFRDMNTCPLMILGKEFEDDKFYHHTYGDLYCENLSPFRNSRQKLRMLEIGLGCGHHNNGRSAQVWKRYFTDDGGPGVSLYEVDFGPSEKHSKCVAKFKKNHPDTCDGIYLGDQSKKEFMNEVVQKSGGKFDIIIDDGGHLYHQQKASFEVLWAELAPGGLYFIEDLQVSSSKDGMVREMLGWADQLATCRHPLCKYEQYFKDDPIAWVKWPTQAPPDMISVHCQSEICVMRKKYTQRLE